MTGFTRARQPEQKEERRAHLLHTARAMLEENAALAELSLNELARRAAMTKSNVYRYFESREHVLLELLRDEWTGWFLALTSTWRRPSRPAAALRALTDHLARTLAARPLLCVLTSALPSVLEQNLSEDAVREFKRLSLAFFEQAASFMVAEVPALTPAEAVQLLHDGVVVVTGLWPYAHPAPAVVRAIASSPELCGFHRDFAADLARLLYAVALDLTSRRP